MLVADPMMATGGSMVHVLKDLVARGATPSLIRVICITCAPPALKQLSELFPGAGSGRRTYLSGLLTSDRGPGSSRTACG